MSLGDIVMATGGRTARQSGPSAEVDIITFIESQWGLNIKLYPVQRCILKMHYGLALDDNEHGFDLEQPIPEDHPLYADWGYFPEDEDGNPLRSDPDWGTYKFRVKVTNWRRENVRYLTEAGYLRWLYKDGRCNIKEVEPGTERRELVLSIGRRSGKTFMCACVVAYEVYKLILKQNPQKYYGLPKTNPIQLISVATDKDQAGVLYAEASGHFSSCSFFRPYTANNTMSYAKFQSPEDILRFGPYKDDPSARATIKVSFKSCVAKGLRGSGNIVIILDELAHFNSAGQSDALSIYRAVKPSLLAFSPKGANGVTPVGPVEGRILSISSPLGRQGFFYQKFRQGFAGGLESQNMLCIQAPTWEVNPSVSATFLAEEYATDPDSFFTEFGASFTDRTRGWLNPPDLLACVVPNLRPATKAPTLAPHFAGLDISSGMKDGDYCALAIGHISDDASITLDYLERIRAGEGDYKGLERLSFDEITQWVYRLSRKFYIESGLFDQWAGQPFEAAMHDRGLTQFRSEFFTKQLSSQLFHNFKTMMFEKNLLLYDFPIPAGEDHCEYIEEMFSLQAEMQSKYVTVVEAPNSPGCHDDQADALVRMVWEATRHFGKRKYISKGSAGPSRHKGSASDIARALSKARQRARLGGSNPMRQRPRR